jgi:hypothetical protein
MQTGQWITNLVSALRVAGTLKLLSLGFCPADIVQLVSAVVVLEYEYDIAA